MAGAELVLPRAGPTPASIGAVPASRSRAVEGGNTRAGPFSS